MSILFAEGFDCYEKLSEGEIENVEGLRNATEKYFTVEIGDGTSYISYEIFPEENQHDFNISFKLIDGTFYITKLYRNDVF